MELVYFILLGIAIAALAIYVIKKPNNGIDQNQLSDLQKQIALTELQLKQSTDLHSRSEAEKLQISNLLKTEKQEEIQLLKIDFNKHLAELKSEHYREIENLKQELTKIREQSNQEFILEKTRLLNENNLKQQDLDIVNKRISSALELDKHQKVKIGELEQLLSQSNQTHKEEIEALQKKLTIEFENIAQKILDEKSTKFTAQNKLNIESVLNPLRDRIKDFESKVDKAYNDENKERATLKAEIKQLVEMNHKVSEEANNLAKALKGDNKMQGNWGEVVLEKILERSGLTKGQEYQVQITTRNVGDEIIKPDVVLFLPEDKNIIIDSKVSLVAYELLVNAESKELKEKHIKDHLNSIRSHVKVLGDKNYQTASGLQSPDFVLLFIPLESSFSIAVQADSELFNYAWDRKIVIVSPSTLLATLRTIASIWKQEKQNKNAMEIARQGADLYDKFVGFTEDMSKIGERLSQTQVTYDDAIKKLSIGKGNLVRRVEELKKLGIASTKQIPDKFIDSKEE